MNRSNLDILSSTSCDPLCLYTIGLVLVLALLLLILLRRQPKHLIAYKTENGNVTVNRFAIVELVRTSCEQFKEIAKPSVKIRTRGKRAHLTIYIKFAGGSSLKEIDNTLQTHLRQNLSENLGIENLGNINIVVTGFKSKKIAANMNILGKAETSSQASFEKTETKQEDDKTFSENDEARSNESIQKKSDQETD